MKEIAIKNAKNSLMITTALTMFIAGFEVLAAFLNYKLGMNFFDIASCVTANMNIYCLILILANIILLPFAVLMYKQNKISLKKEIAEKKTLGRDILLGLEALAITLVLSFVYSFIYTAGRTKLAYINTDSALSTIILQIVSLVFVSGICKEIYFRGFAKRFASEALGETQALLLFNLMFSMLDWHNIGLSFFEGLIWIWAYKKSRHLIAPMIAHGGTNLAAIIFLLITNGAV